jgi:hypothetical protein
LISISFLAELIRQLESARIEAEEKDKQLKELIAQNSELAAKNSELAAKNSVFAAENSVFAAENSELAAQNSELAAQNTVFVEQLHESDKLRRSNFFDNVRPDWTDDDLVDHIQKSEFSQIISESEHLRCTNDYLASSVAGSNADYTQMSKFRRFFVENTDSKINLKQLSLDSEYLRQYAADHLPTEVQLY